MTKKYNSYTVNVSNSYYVRRKDKDGATRLEWAEDFPKERMPSDDGHYTRLEAVSFPTWGKALAYANEKSEGWNCVAINDKCCGQVWQNVLEYSRCTCCGHERMDGLHTDDHHDEPEHDWQLPERA